MTPEKLFDQLLAARAAQPFVTYYDEASGERSELSAKSLANWVAKTHHLLVDELGLQVGDRAMIALPAHWISVPILLGCLTAGLCLADEDAEVAFVDPGAAAGAIESGILDVYAIDPGSAARGFGAETPAGTSDYVTAVRPQADTWGSVQLRGQDGDACIGSSTRSEVVATAAERAQALGLQPSSRALTSRQWRSPQDWLDTVFVPLSVAGSIVFVQNAADDAVVARRMEQERATVRI